MKKLNKLTSSALVSSAGKLLAALLGCVAWGGAQATAEVITSSTSIIVEGDTLPAKQIASGTTIYEIADGAVLSFTRTGTYAGSGGVVNVGAAATLIIKPKDSTGQVLFEGGSALTHAGAILLDANNSYSCLEITNGIFRDNRGGNTPNSGVGGAITNTRATHIIRLTNVLFDSNRSYGNTGAMRVTGTLIMNSGTFINNFAAGDHTGAVHMNGTPNLTFTDVAFIENRAKSYGGALSAGNGSAVLNNVIFKDNWAGTQGGAVRGGQTTGLLLFSFTESNGTNSYEYAGNFASGTTGVVDTGNLDSQVINNAPVFTPLAKGGGFYYAASTGTAQFNVAQGVKFTVGDADAVNRAYDTIASATNTANLAKWGTGDMILNADNRYFSGTTTVYAGRLLLGNENAMLGGIINITQGASFGGSGTATTMINTGDVAMPAQVNVLAGGILQVGLESRATSHLSIDGVLNLSDSIISYVAFGGTHAATLQATTIVANGVNTINMQSFKSGTYTLGNIADELYAGGADKVQFAVNGAIAAAGGRHTVVRVGTGDGLQVSLTVDKSRAVKWTGQSGSDWNTADNNWESLNNAAIRQYAGGDLVYFPGSASGDITVNMTSDSPLVGLEISGNNNITFTGFGGIKGNPYNTDDEAEAAVTAGTGKLTKYGKGTIIFENGNNEFRGGIDIVDGGAIQFSNGQQIQTSSAPISFIESATLCAMGDSVLGNNIAINAQKLATVEVMAEATTQINGVISGASLEKAGDGTLVLAGANTHESTVLKSGGLRIANGGALGSGTLTVAGASTFVEINGGVNLANAINHGSNQLNLAAKGTGRVMVSGNITGSAPMHLSGTNGFTLSGNNSFPALVVTANTQITAASANALGGSNSSVSLQEGAMLTLGSMQVNAKDLMINGGTLAFTNFALGVPLLKLNGTLALENESVIAITAKIPSGGYTLVEAQAISGEQGFDYILNTGSNTAYQYKTTFDNGALRIDAIKEDVNPSKDIVSMYNTLAAMENAVYGRVSESFINPLFSDIEIGQSGNAWVKLIGTFADYKGDETKIGFSDSTYGIVAGYDHPLGERFLIGGYAGYVVPRIMTEVSSESTGKSIHAGVYGSMKLGRFYLTADAMAGSAAIDTNRQEGTGVAKGSYRATAYGASAEAGYVLFSWDQGSIRPTAALHYMDFKYYEQYEVGPGAMYLDNFRASQLQGLVSMQTTYGFETAWNQPGLFDINVGWRANLNDKTPLLSGAYAYDLTNKFHLETDQYVENALVIGLGLRVAISKHIETGLLYDFEVSKGYDRHTVTANFRYSW